ncbi:Ig-like domain-containing protein [Pediococcus acidilactici]|uniref:Ig-like domain-containing protein n=2 Tax=Pediococcus acidilactici TaxID=1254 RepID=UPI0018E0CFA7|nr:Ig-like domain-containing protein [Pediococcus acidilactici]QQC14054.1 KxYKxGKxW signal peptide domain-containing protein [Pediococcus acidilactici]
MNKNPKNHHGVVDSKVSNFKMYKVNKHWVFASALMLSMLGAGMMQTDTAAHADTVNEPQTEMVHKVAEAKEAQSASVTPAKETTAAASSAAPSSAAPAKAAQSSIQNDSAAKVEKGATASSAASSAAPTKAASSAADKSATSAAAQTEQKKADAPSSAAKAEQKNDASASNASKNEQESAKASSAASSSAAKPAADGKDNKAQANNSSAAKPADNSSASNSDASVKKEGVSTDEIGTSGLDTNDQNDINNDAAAKAKADANAQAKDKNAVDNKKVDKDKTAKDRDPRAGISVLEDGSLAIDGSAADGLTLNEDGTYDGNLHFKYNGSAIVAQVGEESNLILQIPPQLRDLFSKINQTGNWTKYFSGDGKFTVTIWPFPSYSVPWTYTNSDFSYDGSTLILKNRRVDFAFEQKTTEINLNFNIGQAVTDFKEQIDNAGDNYTFRAAVIEPTDIIDWHPIGDYAGVASLNTSHLMPTRDELNPPTVNQPVYDNTTTLTGKGEPNAEIVITLPTGGTLRTHTNENGDFSITIPTQPAGSEISVSQNVNGQTSDEVKVPVQKAPEVIEKPGIDAPHAGSKYVTGTGIAGDTIQVYMPGVGGGEDVMIGTTTVGADGKWRAAISDQYNLVEGESIYAVQIKGNSRSDKQYTTVLGEIHVDAPIINPIAEGDTVITGTGEPGDEVTVYFDDDVNSVIGHATVQADGTWTVNAGHTRLVDGDVISAVQTRDGVTSDKDTVSVKAREVVEKPVINDITEGDKVITGTGEAGSELRVYFQDGDVQIGQTVIVRADGTWTVDASHYNLTKGTVVYAVQTRNNVDSERAYSTVKGRENVVKPGINPIREGDQVITGTGVVGDEISVYFQDGDVQIGQTVTVQSDGTWQVDASHYNLTEGTIVYAIQSRDGMNSEKAYQTVLPKPEEIPAPTFDNVREGATTITGRGEAGDTVYVYVKGTNGGDDILVGHATVRADGTWSVATGRVNVYEGDQLYAYQTKGDQQSPNGTTTVLPKQEEVPAPSFDEVREGASTITGRGEVGDTVYVYVKGTNGGDDILVGHATVKADGTWSIDTGRVNLFEGDQLYAYQTRGDQQSSDSTTTVLPKPEELPAPSFDEVREGATTITGRGEVGDIVYVYVKGTNGSDDVLIGHATVKADGTWSVNTGRVSIFEGDQLYAYQTNGDQKSPNGTTTVLPKPEELPAPSFDEVREGASTITGRGEVGDTVYVYVKGTNGSDDILIGHTTVGADGTWSLSTGRVNLFEGDQLYAYQTNGDQQSANGTTTVLPKPEELPAPTFNDVKEGDDTITGKGEVGDTVYVYVKGTNGSDDILIGHTTVGADGTWSLSTGRVNLFEGDQLYAYQTNGDQQSANGTTTVLPKPEELPAPTFNDVKEGDDTITGKGEVGDTVYVYVKGTNGSDDILIGHTTVGADGTWSLSTGRVNLFEGDQLYAYQTNGDQQSANGTTTVLPKPEEIPAPTFDEVKEGDDTISGQGEAGDTVYVYVKGTNGSDDILIGHTTVGADGTWSLSTGRVNIFEGDQLYAYQTKGDKQSPNGTTVVQPKPEEITAPTFSPVTEGDTTIRGQGTAGDTVYVYVKGTNGADDIVIGHTTVGSDGTWTLSTGRVKLLAGDELHAYQTKDGKQGPEGTTIVKAKETVNPPSMDGIIAGDSVIKGKGKPGATVTVTLPNGDPLPSVTVDANGNWTVDVGDAKLQPGDKVTAVQADGDNVSDPTTQIVQERTAPPVINGIIEGATTITGTGKPGATVTVTLPSGETSKPVTIDAEGNWTLDVSGEDLKAGDEVTAVQADGDNVSEEASQIVQKRTDKPSINGIIEGATTISGKGVPGATVTVTIPGGKTLDPVTVDAEGNWTVDVGDAKLQPGDEVTAVQADGDNVSEETSQIVQERTAPPTVNDIKEDATTIKGKGIPGATITVTGPDGEPIGDPVTVGKNGVWVVDASGADLKAGDEVSVVQTVDDNASEPVKVTVGS